MSLSQTAFNAINGGVSSATGIADQAARGIAGSAMPFMAPLGVSMIAAKAMENGGSHGSAESSHSEKSAEEKAFLEQAIMDRKVFFLQTKELQQFHDATKGILGKLNNDINPYLGFNTVAVNQMGVFRQLFSRLKWADKVVSVHYVDPKAYNNHSGLEYHKLYIGFLNFFQDGNAFVQAQARMEDPRYFMILGLYNGLLQIHERFKDNAAERLPQLEVMLEFFDYIGQQADLGIKQGTRIVEAVKSFVSSGEDTTSEFIRICGETRDLITKHIEEATKKADIEKIQTSLKLVSNELSNVIADIHNLILRFLSERDPGEDIFGTEGNRSALRKDGASLETVLRDARTSASFRAYFRGREALFNAIRAFATPERERLLKLYDQSVKASDERQIRAYAEFLEASSQPRLTHSVSTAPLLLEDKEHSEDEHAEATALMPVDPAHLQLSPEAQENKRAYEANLRASAATIDGILDILPPHLKRIYESEDEACKMYRHEMQDFIDNLKKALKSSLNLDNLRDLHNYMREIAEMAGVFTSPLIEAFLRFGCDHAETHLDLILEQYDNAIKKATTVATQFRTYTALLHPSLTEAGNYHRNITLAAAALGKVKKRIKTIKGLYKTIREELDLVKTMPKVRELVATGSLMAGRLALEGFMPPFSQMMQNTRAATAAYLLYSEQRQKQLTSGASRQRGLLTMGESGTGAQEMKSGEGTIDISDEDEDAHTALVPRQPRLARREKIATSEQAMKAASMHVEEPADEKPSDQKKSAPPPAPSSPSLAPGLCLGLEPLALALHSDSDISSISRESLQLKLKYVEKQQLELQGHQAANKRALETARQALQKVGDERSVAGQTKTRISDTRNSTAYKFLNSPGWGWRFLRWFPVIGWLAWLGTWLLKGIQCKESTLLAEETAAEKQLGTLPRRESELQSSLDALQEQARLYQEQMRAIEEKSQALRNAIAEEKHSLAAIPQAPQTPAAFFPSASVTKPAQAPLLVTESPQIRMQAAAEGLRLANLFIQRNPDETLNWKGDKKFSDFCESMGVRFTSEDNRKLVRDNFFEKVQILRAEKPAVMRPH